MTETLRGDQSGGIQRVRHERTEDLAREVLHDLKCLEHCSYQCAHLAADPNAKREMRIPAIILQFDYPEADRAPALAIGLVHWAMGTRTDDDLKRTIRTKVEAYLKMIGIEPGRNEPKDMRLSEEFYA